MRNKYCVIKQPAGLGDIIFCQKIAHHFRAVGYTIVWAIADVFKETVEKHMPDFKYCSIDDEYYTSNTVILPLDGCTSFTKNKSFLESKYEVAGLEFDDWKDYFNFKRFLDKEDELYYNILELKDGEEYIFVNDLYGSPPGEAVKPMTIPKGKKVIKLEILPGFTLFDWLKVIEGASEIWSVDTAIIYILEKIDLTGKRLELFSRFTPSNYFHIKNLYKQPWRYNE